MAIEFQRQDFNFEKDSQESLHWRRCHLSKILKDLGSKASRYLRGEHFRHNK